MFKKKKLVASHGEVLRLNWAIDKEQDTSDCGQEKNKGGTMNYIKSMKRRSGSELSDRTSSQMFEKKISLELEEKRLSKVKRQKKLKRNSSETRGANFLKLSKTFKRTSRQTSEKEIGRIGNAACKHVLKNFQYLQNNRKKLTSEFCKDLQSSSFARLLRG